MADDDVIPNWELVATRMMARQAQLEAGRVRRRDFARDIRERRRTLREIYEGENSTWPPPNELAPWADWSLRELPELGEAQLIVECRNRLRIQGRPHARKRYACGPHIVVEELRSAGYHWVTWPKVKWALDVFGDVIVVEEERAVRQQKALEAIGRQKRELLELQQHEQDEK